MLRMCGARLINREGEVIIKLPELESEKPLQSLMNKNISQGMGEVKRRPALEEVSL